MRAFGLGLVIGLLAGAPAWAQGPAQQPAQGFLHAPSAAERAAAAAPVKPPTRAPRASVQQVAPFSAPMPPPSARSALGHSAPGKVVVAGAKQTPVVAPPHSAPKTTPHSPAKPAGKAAGTAAGAAAGAAGAAAGAATKEAPKPAEPAKRPEEKEPEAPKGSVTGLPLPRWASLRSDEVNMRTGPGMRYPIEWVYRRRDLPVQIEREFEVWRLVEDEDGVKGWVHQATLTGRRSFEVKGSERVLRRLASEESAAVAKLKPGVVGHLRSCEAKAAWCQVQVADYRGWLPRDGMYGIYAGEAVNP